MASLLNTDEKAAIKTLGGRILQSSGAQPRVRQILADFQSSAESFEDVSISKSDWFCSFRRAVTTPEEAGVGPVLKTIHELSKWPEILMLPAVLHYATNSTSLYDKKELVRTIQSAVYSSRYVVKQEENEWFTEHLYRFLEYQLCRAKVLFTGRSWSAGFPDTQDSIQTVFPDALDVLQNMLQLPKLKWRLFQHLDTLCQVSQKTASELAQILLLGVCRVGNASDFDALLRYFTNLTDTPTLRPQHLVAILSNPERHELQQRFHYFKTSHERPQIVPQYLLRLVYREQFDQTAEIFGHEIFPQERHCLELLQQLHDAQVICLVGVDELETKQLSVFEAGLAFIRKRKFSEAVDFCLLIQKAHREFGSLLGSMTVAEMTEALRTPTQSPAKKRV